MNEEYTLKQCKEDMLHKWKWLSENPDKEPYHYNKEFKNKPFCGCCVLDNDNCDSCPITWGSGIYETNKTNPFIWKYNCTDNGSPFQFYNRANDQDRIRSKAIYAKEVYKLSLQIKV